jgi:hypothetical protein
MSEEHYIKCPYCSKTIKYGDSHLESCTPNYIDGQLLWCFSCGEKNGEYSNSQLAKEDKARCFNCVKTGKIDKFKPYDYFETTYHEKHSSIDKQLERAVSNLDLEKVQELLLLNANPNYTRQTTFYCRISHKRLFSYNIDGSEKPELDKYQPTTPLKMCVFRFSDCELTDFERLKIIDIAKQLINSGASVFEAKEYYESRYGVSETDTIKHPFYKLLCNNTS